MKLDKEGFMFPVVVNESACINCGLCAKVCPWENKIAPEQEHQQSYYGAYNINVEDIINSSSGGVYPALAKWVIAQGGIVYGAMLDDEHNLYHVGASDVVTLNKTLGSKYLQSDINGTYKECKSFLDSGRIVLYTGTPCQVHGLKRYLRKDYDNLYTADVICHGVPSAKMFHAYIDFLERKHKGRLVDINFRDKEKNRWSITLMYTIEHHNGKRKKYYLENRNSEYFVAFLRGYIERESCYECPFSSLNRPGDITMGDFWGYQYKRPDLKHEEGLSLILSNNPKGDYLIEVLRKEGIHFNVVDETCVEASENKNLYKPTKRPRERDLIYDELETKGFDFIADKYFRNHESLVQRVKNKIYTLVSTKKL